MNGYKIVLLKAIFMLYKLPECERVCSGICINGKRSPLMVAVAQTTASLYKCFCGEIRRISYPER